MSMLFLGFNDFKRLAGNHRIYYFDGVDFMDLHYLVDGHIIKTVLDKSVISNPKQFFSDKLFYGAIKLTFRLPDESDRQFTVKMVNESGGLDIQGVQDEEVKKEDIQRDSGG